MRQVETANQKLPLDLRLVVIAGAVQEVADVPRDRERALHLDELAPVALDDKPVRGGAVALLVIGDKAARLQRCAELVGERLAGLGLGFDAVPYLLSAGNVAAH